MRAKNQQFKHVGREAYWFLPPAPDANVGVNLNMLTRRATRLSNVNHFLLLHGPAWHGILIPVDPRRLNSQIRDITFVCSPQKVGISTPAITGRRRKQAWIPPFTHSSSSARVYDWPPGCYYPFSSTARLRVHRMLLSPYVDCPTVWPPRCYHPSYICHRHASF